VDPPYLRAHPQVRPYDNDILILLLIAPGYSKGFKKVIFKNNQQSPVLKVFFCKQGMMLIGSMSFVPE